MTFLHLFDSEGLAGLIVTDKASLKEIARQEKRFAAADCGRGRK